MDRIELSALRVLTRVGLLPHEREAVQPLQFDLVIYADLHDAGHSDELSDTVNYSEVAETVGAVARASQDLLLERLAARVADALLGLRRVEALDLTVTKLRPTIPEDVALARISIHRRRAEQPEGERVTLAIVAIGSNLGDRLAYLRRAVSALHPIAQSQVYETAPVGGPLGQGAFLNMVVCVETTLDPFAFVRRLQRLELENERQKGERWGPRTLDLDLLFFGQATISDPQLQVPHPRLGERAFVLLPLAEVAPERCPIGWEQRTSREGVLVLGRLEAL